MQCMTKVHNALNAINMLYAGEAEGVPKTSLVKTPWVMRWVGEGKGGGGGGGGLPLAPR